MDLIVEQLNNLGQLNSGQWPLLLLIDNALPYAQAYEQPEAVLKGVRQALVKAYEES